MKKKQIKVAIKCLKKAINKLDDLDFNNFEMDLGGMISQMNDDLFELEAELEALED